MNQPDAFRGYVLAESGHRDRELAARLAMWRDGWRACEIRAGEQYDAGYADGLLARKHAQHDIIGELRLEKARWGPGGRGHFADPRPGDYAGNPAARGRGTA